MRNADCSLHRQGAKWVLSTENLLWHMMTQKCDSLKFTEPKEVSAGELSDLLKRTLAISGMNDTNSEIFI